MGALAAGAMLSFTSGCGSATRAPERDSVEVRAPGEIAPGFEIKLSSLEDQSLNGKFMVEFESRLRLPYNVTINTEGLNRDTLHAKINEAYSKFFKTQPNIGVAIAEEKYWIDIRGLVDKPGRFRVKSSTSLDEALSLAGGLQKTATVRYVKIQQGPGSTTIKLSDYYAGSANDQIPKWQGGDIVFFQSDRDYTADVADLENAYVQLIGEVRTPGEYRYLKGADFYYYLAKAGGPTEKADLLKIEVLRNLAGQGKTSSMFELSDPKEVPLVRAGDMIFLHADKTTPSERTVSLAAGIFGILNTMLVIILLF